VDRRLCRELRFTSAARQVDKTREEASQRLAAAGRRDDKCIASAGDFVEKFELMRVGAPTRARNQPANGSGSETRGASNGRLALTLTCLRFSLTLLSARTNSGAIRVKAYDD
jgi:hypothetical protein